MARMSTPTYTIEFALSIPVWQQHRLEKKFKIARNVNNSCLGEALKRYKRGKAFQRKFKANIGSFEAHKVYYNIFFKNGSCTNLQFLDQSVILNKNYFCSFSD